MSDAYSNGQEFVFGVDDFKEQGFLDGATLTIVDARYGENKYANRADISPKLAVFFKFRTNGGKEIEKAYTTGFDWEDAFTVASDSKSLVVKDSARAKKPSKNSNFYFFLTRSIESGLIGKSEFKGNLSVFVGKSFVAASEKNPNTPQNANQYVVPNTVVGTPATAATASETSKVDEGTIQKSLDVLTRIMEARNGEAIGRGNIPQAISTVAKDLPAEDRKAITTTLFLNLPDVVAASNGTLVLDGDKVVRS